MRRRRSPCNLVYLANGAIFARRNEDTIIEFVRCNDVSTISCGGGKAPMPPSRRRRRRKRPLITILGRKRDHFVLRFSVAKSPLLSFPKSPSPWPISCPTNPVLHESPRQTDGREKQRERNFARSPARSRRPLLTRPIDDGEGEGGDEHDGLSVCPPAFLNS